MDTLVLGIGNVLWADEGFGVRAVETLHARYCFPFEVRVMDGGTQGMFLLPYVCAASKLLIFDAIDFGLTPGELRLIKDDDVPQYLGAKKISMHQTGFQEVLASAKLMDKYPSRLALIGVQPEELDDYGGSLRPKIKARIPQAIDLSITVLKAWGIRFEKRKDSLSKQDQLRPEQLALASYESERSSI